MISIVVLSKYQDIFDGFKKSVETFCPNHPKILVRDGDEVSIPPDWVLVQGPSKFSMAGNANLGLRAVKEGDILYCGDDVRFTSPVDELESILHSDPSIGILSPRIIGGVGNPLQNHPGPLLCETKMLCFVCILISRKVIDRVGYLDERFTEYGYDDDDYSRRVISAGFKLLITPSLSVIHQGATATFRRNEKLGGKSIASQMRDSYELFKSIHY